MNVFTIKIIVQASLLLTTGIFDATSANAQQTEYPIPENEARMHYMLGIIGYNYTDNPIAAFSIDGRGGGDVQLSSPDAGGSKTVCCVLLSKKTVWPMQVSVRWQVGGCRVFDEDRKFGHNQYYYKETFVQVERGSAHPTDIAVHFFKDGSVRVRLQEGWDLPILELAENRSTQHDFQECKPGEPVQYR